MKLPIGISSGAGGGRQRGMTQQALPFNPMTKSGAAFGNPVGAIYEGRAWAGVGRAISKTANQFAELHQVRREQQAAAETNEAYMQKTANYVEWKKSMAAQEFIPIEEVPPDVMESLGIRDTDYVVDKEGNMIEEPRTAVPKHEVFAEMERKFLNTQTEASGSLISDTRYRDEWLLSEADYNQNTYAKSSIQSIEQGVAFDSKKELSMYDAAINAGNIALAKHIVRTMQYQPAEAKSEMIKLANKTGEENRYKEILTTVDKMAPSEALSMLTSARDHVDPANPDYREAGTGMSNNNLNIDERLSFYSSFQKKINAIDTQNKTDYSNLVKQKEANAKAIIKTIKDGGRTSPTTNSEVIADLETMPKKHRNDLLIQELRVSVALEPELMKMAPMTMAERHAEAAAMQNVTRALPGDMEPVSAKQISDLYKESAARMDNDFKDNQMEYLRKYEIDNSVIDINFNQPAEKWGSTLAFRKENAVQTIGTFGQGINHIFLDSEVEQINNILENGTFGQKMDLLTGLRGGLGDDLMRTAMGQLGAKGASVTYTTTGNLLADGKPNAAKYNMMGYETRKGFPDIVKSKEFGEVFDDVTTNAYANDPGQQRAVMESSLNIYAFLSALDGETTDDFNDDRYQQAIKLAMGDRAIVQFANSNIVPPDESVTTDSFNKYVKKVTMNDIAMLSAFGGGLDGMKNLDFLTRMKKGEFEMINASGDSVLFYGVTGPVKTKDGNVFTLPMNSADIAAANMPEPPRPPSPAESAISNFLDTNTISVGRRQRKNAIMYFGTEGSETVIEKNRRLTKEAEERIKNRKK